MTEEEHRHGMMEFHSRLTRVESKVESLQSEITGFKTDFHDHDVTEREDRKEIIRQQKETGAKLECIKQHLAEMRGFKAGMKAGAVAIVMVFGGIATLALKKLLGW